MFEVILRSGWGGSEGGIVTDSLVNALMCTVEYQKQTEVPGSAVRIYHAKAKATLPNGGIIYSACYVDGVWDDPTWHNWQNSVCPIPS